MVHVAVAEAIEIVLVALLGGDTAVYHGEGRARVLGLPEHAVDTRSKVPVDGRAVWRRVLLVIAQEDDVGRVVLRVVALVA